MTMAGGTYETYLHGTKLRLVYLIQTKSASLRSKVDWALCTVNYINETIRYDSSMIDIIN